MDSSSMLSSSYSASPYLSLSETVVPAVTTVSAPASTSVFLVSAAGTVFTPASTAASSVSAATLVTATTTASTAASPSSSVVVTAATTSTSTTTDSLATAAAFRAALVPHTGFYFGTALTAVSVTDKYTDRGSPFSGFTSKGGDGRPNSYIVTQRGIEASTEQIKAVLQLESPEKPKDVQRLAGKVAALSRFISRSSDKCRLFYNILRKIKRFEWTAEHEQAFRELNHYLSTPPLLSKPEQGEALFLSLAVTEVAVSAVLVREQDKEQRPVYYVSKSLLPVETRYDPRTAIKSQALTDFVSDLSPAIQNLVDKEILTLKGDRDAEATNNETEYKALILGIQLALELGVRNLQVPKDQNMEVDALATLGETFKPTDLASVPIVHVFEPSIKKEEEEDKGELEDQQDGATVLSSTDDQSADQDWRMPYLEWLRHGKLPDYQKEIRGFKMKASRFTLIDNVLACPPQWRMYGIPSEIICDNGSQFVSNDAEEYCVRWNISLKKSAPRTPKSNGQAQSRNKIIMDNLRRILQELGGKWADELPLLLWYGCMTGELNKAEMIRSADTLNEVRASAKIRLSAYK
ncbi:uncharacterized protein LOC141649544 [Silene latifolia]|uniref:uncharacterized protein LOC141649544 n=1 Tax=Silene latifolia TaxID=37657 RepID=UPI003D783D42